MLYGKIISLLLIFPVFLSSTACSVDKPVEKSYYTDLSRIKGGEKPAPPQIISVDFLPAERELQINFSSDGSDGPGGPEGAYDPDTGTNENLVYYLYYTDGSDPPPFPDEHRYYSEIYYLGYVRESDYSGDPKLINEIYVSESFAGTLYFWMTSGDGGRESDRSDIAEVVIP